MRQCARSTSGWDDGTVQSPAGQSRAWSEITIVANGYAIFGTIHRGPAGPCRKCVSRRRHPRLRPNGRRMATLWSDNQLGAKLMSGKPSGADIVYTWNVIENGKRIPKRYTSQDRNPDSPAASGSSANARMTAGTRGRSSSTCATPGLGRLGAVRDWRLAARKSPSSIGERRPAEERAGRSVIVQTASPVHHDVSRAGFGQAAC